MSELAERCTRCEGLLPRTEWTIILQVLRVGILFIYNACTSNIRFIVLTILARHKSLGSLVRSHINALVPPPPFVVILYLSMTRSGLRHVRKLASRLLRLARKYAGHLKSMLSSVEMI